MRTRRSRKRGARLGLNLTSMIDVVFLLIIFFMATAQFARLTKVDLQLPNERGERELADAAGGMIVNVTASGEIIVDREVIDVNRLLRMVAAEVGRAGSAGSVESGR